MKNTIAFVSTYTHPARDRTEAAIRAAFPQYKLENIDLGKLIGARRDWLLPNLACVAREFGSDVLLRRATLRTRYFQTTYLFRKVREAIREHIDPERHVFSFQTHSLYDCSVPDVPHFVYTDHTHLSNLAVKHFDRRRLRSASWLGLERSIYENAARVFTFSSDVAADVVRHYGIAPERVQCVYAGSNIDVDPETLFEKRTCSNRQILFVGNDWERKGGPDLVAAFQKVLKVHPDARLVIAGASPTLRAPNCTVIGRTPLHELARHYASSSLFCMPTRTEPFGIAFVEAMLHRLPVIGTRVGAIPEMVADGVTGTLVEPGDVDALAGALSDWLGDPDRCVRAGEAGYERANRLYTWSAVGERMRESISAAMGHRTPAGTRSGKPEICEPLPESWREVS